jgi:peptidoglycan/LPS O-acetylase OafA/YrhL
MYRNQRLVLYAVLTTTLVLLSLYHLLVSIDSSSFFCMMLLGLLILIWIKRKKSTRIVIAAILGLLSYIAWFSTGPLTESANLILGEQRIIAVLLWGVALFLLILEPRRIRRRKHFTQLVKREVIHKQKNRCATCKRKLGPYVSNFHHVNGDRSDNRLSNCNAFRVS